MGPRVLYLHGFGSGPSSTKGTAFAHHFAARGVTVDRLDLRVPSFEHLRLSAMIDTARAAIGGPEQRAIVIGSSLGGLTAARLAEREPRVSALVLFAPAFQLVARWRDSLGAAVWADWQRSGWRTVVDYTTQQPGRVDFAFTQDVAGIDIGFPEVRVPTLIVHGVDDEVVPVAHSRQFAADRPHVRLVEVDDGHELTASLPRLRELTDEFLVPWLGAAR